VVATAAAKPHRSEPSGRGPIGGYGMLLILQSCLQLPPYRRAA
jgi:hypothetical protein